MVSYLFWCVLKAGTMNGTASLLNDHVYPIYIISSVTAICKEEILLFLHLSGPVAGKELPLLCMQGILKRKQATRHAKDRRRVAGAEESKRKYVREDI